jgi:hypothetical protein
MSLRQLAWRLKEHYLIFEEEETESIYRAWGRLIETTSDWSQTHREAEQFLFGPVLKSLTARQQFSHLLERPDDVLDLSKWQSTFLPLEDWGTVQEELDSSYNIKKKQRILWFVSAHPEVIPRDFVSEKLVVFLNHEDSFIRSLVLKTAYVTKNEEIIAAFLESQWTWSSSFCTRENHWGNLLLCEHGSSLTYSDLRNRVHPNYLGYAVKCRGLKDEEVEQYAEDIDHIWSSIGTKIPDLPVDFPPVEIEVYSNRKRPTRQKLSSSTLSKSVTFQSRSSVWGGVNNSDPSEMFQSWEAASEERRKLAEIALQAIKEQTDAGNLWFAQRFHADALERVLEIRPDLVSKWVNFALTDSDGAVRNIRLARAFYDALCKVLLKHQPTIGTRLYERLMEIPGGISVCDAYTKFLTLDIALFKAPAIEDIYPIWSQRLEQCVTDQELMQIAIAAQLGNGQDWLRSYIDEQLIDSAPLKTSRAYTLLGFVDTQDAFEHLNQLVETEPDTWRGKLLKTSLNRWQMNAWAKHWFERFLIVENNVRAWAAFRLFLYCVDSRFWLWQQKIQDQVESNARQSDRLAFVQDNSHTIRNRIRKNEKRLKDQLFRQKTKFGQAWPWM